MIVIMITNQVVSVQHS